MKLGCCSWSHHRCFESGELDLDAWIEMCALELNCGGIEITDGHMASTDIDYINHIKRLSADLGLIISGYTVSNDFGKKDKVQLESELERTISAIEVSAKLGTPLLRVFAGWPEGDREEAWPVMVEYMKKSVAVAKKHGIMLAVENHNHGGFIQTYEHLARILGDVDSKWLRLNLDTDNYIDGWKSIERSAPHTVHVHAKMHNVGPDGSDADIDYPAVIEFLRKNKYRGFIDLEYEGDEAERPAVARGMEYLRSLIFK